MGRFFVGGVSIDLPAVPVLKASTRDLDAWRLRQYVTVRLVAPVEGVRVHTNNKSLPKRKASAPEGAWVAIGDFVETSKEFVNSRALPGPFTHLAWAVLPEQCVVNVGLCGPLFGGAGGGFQAEYISGPPIQFTQAHGKHWHGSYGHA
jgi:hypothetical protein